MPDNTEIKKPPERTAKRPLDKVLYAAWRRLFYYDRISFHEKSNFVKLRRYVIIITVLATFASVSVLLFGDVSGQDEQLRNFLALAAIALPMIALGFMQYIAQFATPTTWIQYRYAAERIRSEIYLYRTGTGKYNIAFEKRDDLLQEKVEEAAKIIAGTVPYPAKQKVKKPSSQMPSATWEMMRDSDDDDDWWGEAYGAEEEFLATYHAPQTLKGQIKNSIKWLITKIWGPLDSRSWGGTDWDDDGDNTWGRDEKSAQKPPRIIRWLMGNWLYEPWQPYYWIDEIKDSIALQRAKDLIRPVIDPRTGDDGFTMPITMNEYMRYRVHQQMRWYNHAVARMYRITKRFSATSIMLTTFASIIGVLLASQPNEIRWVGLVALANAVNVAVSNWGNMSMFGQTYKIFDDASHKLDNHMTYWHTLQNNPDFINNKERYIQRFIVKTERILMYELQMWYDTATETQLANDQLMMKAIDTAKAQGSSLIDSKRAHLMVSQLPKDVKQEIYDMLKDAQEQEEEVLTESQEQEENQNGKTTPEDTPALTPDDPVPATE